MNTAHELFLHELNDMLDAERKILDGLEEQAAESSKPELKKAFDAHHSQTERQIERLQRCFQELSEKPEETQCAAIKGFLEDHDHVKDENPSSDIMDVFNVMAAVNIEHYEIAAYESLIRMANMMNHKIVSKLLNQSLKEEQQALRKMENFANKIKPEHLGAVTKKEERKGAVIAISEGVKRTAATSRISRERSRRAA